MWFVSIVKNSTMSLVIVKIPSIVRFVGIPITRQLIAHFLGIIGLFVLVMNIRDIPANDGAAAC